MDEQGVSQIARWLGLNYAYYPSVIYPATGRYYGPAILSPWPIERSWKVVIAGDLNSYGIGLLDRA